MEKAGFKSKLQAIETAAYKLLNYILSAAAGFMLKTFFLRSHCHFYLSLPVPECLS